MERQLIQSIKDAIAAAESNLRDSWSKEPRLGVIELVRTIDTEQLGTWGSRRQAESDPDLDWLYVNGYPTTLQTFMDESTLSPGFPLFPSSMEVQTWAASALQQGGRIELFRRVVTWCRASLATIRAMKDGTLEVSDSMASVTRMRRYCSRRESTSRR